MAFADFGRGSAKLGKGDENAAAILGRKAIDENSRSIPTEQGKYILSASQAAREAFGLKTDGNSLFTFYLLDDIVHLQAYPHDPVYYLPHVYCIK